MTKKIVSTGRGGTGKSTFVALAVKYLNSAPLLIDIDPDQNLADMVGVDLEKEGIRTISDVLFDIQKGKGYEEFASMPMPKKIEYLFHSDCLYESEDFDLISLGVKFTKGCYCMPNNLLRGIIPSLANSYTYTLIDSPAGLEHLNRKVISDIDDMYVILDPSMKSLRNLQRIQKLAKEIDVSIENLYLVGNYRFKESLEEYLKDVNGTYLGMVGYDDNVEEYNFVGKSLLELPDDSPACLSIKRIIEKTNYRMKDSNE